MKLQYRPEIDGLRAIAVLSVVLFHIEIPGFSRGFLGVDIFYVISGFLITKIINKDISAGTFSFSNFYGRRIRRIFPALFFVVGVVLIFSWLLFDQNAFSGFGKSLLGATWFVSNIFFWAESGYFSAPSLEKPLLHTWSLSVEEQFYIIFPVLILFLYKYVKGYASHVIFALGVLSYMICVYGDYHHPSATFYLVLTRAWELLCGAILAFPIIAPVSNAKLREIFSFLGLLLIAVGILCFNVVKDFPVHQGIVVVAGACLIIHANERNSTVVSRFLANKYFVLIGLISYSLYLWHWPLVVFFNYIIIRPLLSYEKLVIFILSLVFAYFTWRYVESPFRVKKRQLISRKVLFSGAAIAMLISTISGAAIYMQDGMGWRYPEGERILAQGNWHWHSNGRNPMYGDLELNADFDVPAKCGSMNSAPDFVLWGDSHAMSLIPGCDASARKHHRSGVIFTHRSCPPFYSYDHPRSRFDTKLFAKNIIDYISINQSIKTVFIAAAWYDYFELYQLPEDSSGELTFNAASRGFAQVIDELLKLNLNIYVFTDIPWIKDVNYTVRSFYLSSRYPGAYNIQEIVPTPTIDEYREMNGDILSFLFALKESKGIHLLHLENHFYDQDGRFKLTDGNLPLYRDSGHLSTHGSNYLSFVFDEIFSSTEELSLN